MIFADAGERTISVACVQAEAAEASLWRRLLTTREQRILQDVLGTLQLGGDGGDKGHGIDQSASMTCQEGSRSSIRVVQFHSAP